MGSIFPNNISFQGLLDNNILLRCGWSFILEKIFNDVFFGGKDVVKVSNNGIPGTTSNTGVLVMEHGLLPTPTPHIVVSSYAANEDKRPEKMVREQESSFIQASKQLRMCDDHLPLVVMANHLFGTQHIEHEIKESGIYFELTKWFDIMAFDESNIGLHEVVYNYQNDTAVELLTGSDYNVHLGYGFHLSMAWTALFNFVDAFVNNCNDLDGIQPTTTTTTGDNESATESVSKRLSLKNLPTLTKDMEVPTLVDTWNQQDENQSSQCSKGPPPSNTKHTNFFFLAHAGGVDTLDDLRSILKPVLQTSRGWEVAAFRNLPMKMGLFANSTDAKFRLKIPVATVSSELIISYLKSYGQSWIESELEVKIKIQRANGKNDTKTFHLSGYHETHDSQHFLQQISLPEPAAAEGDVITLTFTMVGGYKFKINGILL